MGLRQNIYCCLLTLLMTGLFSCRSSEIREASAYMKYLSDPGNGLVKEKSVAGIRYRIKYLPTDYLAYNAFKDARGCDKDSLRRVYGNSLTFLVNIGPAEGEHFDITRLDVADYHEFAARIEAMAFQAQDWIRLQAAGKEYSPVIVRLESIHAQDNSRNFIAVFARKNEQGDLDDQDLCFSYRDELFNTGLNKFIFRHKDMSRLPDLRF